MGSDVAAWHEQIHEHQKTLEVLEKVDEGLQAAQVAVQEARRRLAVHRAAYEERARGPKRD